MSSLDHWGMTDMTLGEQRTEIICLWGFSEHHMSFITCIVMHRAPPNYEARIVHREKIYGGKKDQKKRKKWISEVFA